MKDSLEWPFIACGLSWQQEVTEAKEQRRQGQQSSTGDFSSRNQHHTKCLRAEEEAEEQLKRTNMAKETVEVHRE